MRYTRCDQHFDHFEHLNDLKTIQVMIVDGGIKRLLPDTYLHWLVMNVPGKKVEGGVEVFQYVTPFSLELEDDGSIIKDTKESSHPMIVLVFKQRSGKVAI